MPQERTYKVVYYQSVLDFVTNTLADLQITLLSPLESTQLPPPLNLLSTSHKSVVRENQCYGGQSPSLYRLLVSHTGPESAGKMPPALGSTTQADESK